MPIKALTQRTVVMPPIVGRLWKGSEKQTSKKGAKIFGKDLKTHFRFTSNIPKAETAFTEVFGNEPTNIPFYLPFQDVDANFNTWQEEYTSQRLQHRCDGEFVTRYYDKQQKRYVDPPPNTMPCPGGCDWVGRLWILIPQFVHKGYAGVVNLTLKSKNEVPAMYSELLYYHEQRGDLRGLEFVLYRYPKSISTPDGARVEKWLVGIKPNAQFVMSMIESQAAEQLPGNTALALPDGDEQLALPEGEFEDDGDSAESPPASAEPSEPDLAIIQSEELRSRFEALVTDVYNGDGAAKREQFRSYYKASTDDDFTDVQLEKLIEGLEKKQAELARQRAARPFTKYTHTLLELYPDTDARNKAEAVHCTRCSVNEMMDAEDEQLELLVREMQGALEVQREQAAMAI